jgi:hypothetical protein
MAQKLGMEMDAALSSDGMTAVAKWAVSMVNPMGVVRGVGVRSVVVGNTGVGIMKKSRLDMVLIGSRVVGEEFSS